MIVSSILTETSALAQSLPREQAHTLASILSLRTSPARHHSLTVRSGLPLGAIIIADSFHGLLRHLWRAA
jgi:hypothetical protein